MDSHHEQDARRSTPLTTAQSEAPLELASRGAGGSFDQTAFGEKFRMGPVDVQSGRVTLTVAGREAIAKLMHGLTPRPCGFGDPRHRDPMRAGLTGC